MKLIVQIPAFNEEATIAATIRDIPKTIDGITSVETLVIDDGSSDKTADAARKAGANHVVQLKTHRGLSAAFVAGIDASLRLGADIIVNTDADNQYVAADIAKLIAPIVTGTAEVVVGDREVSKSPHMSGFKRMLQRLGSRTVSLASGIDVNDVTSGFRAFSREAAMQINVFNPFTYTLETIIQSGNHNLGVQSVAIRTNAPTRPSRLYRGLGTYLRKSIATIFRISTVYRPLKTFAWIGSILMLAGVILGLRFVWAFLHGNGGGHVQSLILCAVFLVTGFQTWLIALVADLIAVNRRLSEDMLLRLKRLEMPRVGQALSLSGNPVRSAGQPGRAAGGQPERLSYTKPRKAAQQPQQAKPQPQQQPQPQAEKPADTQWVWLDENKLDNRNASASPAPAIEPEDDEPEPPAEGGGGGGGNRRRRRRGRGGPRQHPELPGNRGKHVSGEDE
ncbi:MAG TPA: glycosyltransferase family 2 protein [Thermoanaerobaculia bacterium]|nr:glycosyltransferase family 2 protein [Thermoanaerobaculia bacterium]